jgi:hypothetical protein
MPVNELSPSELNDPNINPLPSEPSETSAETNGSSTPTEGSKWQATIREKLRTVETPFGPVRLGGRIIGTFKEGDAFPGEDSEVTVQEIVVELQEGLAGQDSRMPTKVRLSNGKEILKAGAEEAAQLIDSNPPAVNTDDPTLPTGPTGGPDLDPAPTPGESTPGDTPPTVPPTAVNDEGIDWVEITVNNVKYLVGTDYVRNGNEYATFSGDSARSTTQSKGWIMPTKEICEEIGRRARKIVMPTQNQYDPNGANYRGPRGNARLHTQQILTRTGGSFPTDFVVGHKKDVVQGSGQPGSTCLWGGWKGNGWWQSGGCPHGALRQPGPGQTTQGCRSNHTGPVCPAWIDYSQGLRPVKRVRTT